MPPLHQAVCIFSLAEALLVCAVSRRLNLKADSQFLVRILSSEFGFQSLSPEHSGKAVEALYRLAVVILSVLLSCGKSRALFFPGLADTQVSSQSCVFFRSRAGLEQAPLCFWQAARQSRTARSLRVC